jgi:hypothetical protein
MNATVKVARYGKQEGAGVKVSVVGDIEGAEVGADDARVDVGGVGAEVGAVVAWQ